MAEEKISSCLGVGIPKETAEEGAPRVYQLEGEVGRQKISLTNDFAQAGERYRSLSKMGEGATLFVELPVTT